MKVFEAWYKKEGYGPLIAVGNKEFIKDGWKAALEWILVEGIIENDYAGTLIKEELGE